MKPVAEHFFPVQNYRLDLTLACGQAFRWRKTDAGWEGVVAGQWILLQPQPDGLRAVGAEPITEWQWLADYLQVHVRLEEILQAFPARDPHLQQAVRACYGMRLLRQEPWECLASFLLSSTKQIPHIQQIIECLCVRFGAPVRVPPDHAPAYAFPAAAALAALPETALRDCRMGFRARALREAARRVAEGRLNLQALRSLDESAAREQLMALRGVGPKIANCVLLFAYGFPRAFPVDVWVRRALQTAYFRGRHCPPRQIEAFVRRHFGPQAGYAQQYLFHYWRTHHRRRHAAHHP